VKNRCNRIFWTALGMTLLGEKLQEDVEGLPEGMQDVLKSPPVLPEENLTMYGTDLQDRKGRYIYTATWKILRDIGFKRPFRYPVNEDIEVLVPFVSNSIAVSPQGFQNRVPSELRAYALVGKSAVLRSSEVHYVVCAARYDPDAWNILKKGKCSVCTPDRLTELLSALDFS